MDNFKFKLNKEKTKSADGIIYVANKLNAENYIISWECESGRDEISYPVAMVEALLEDGTWIVVDNK
ncbi:hypothetical protein ABE137_07185 [Brevibacillus laterosporus]|uniref:hypothetical protein n=1 Tax=Brevibacillus laterosporus TaxID=1465 RepID=UPI003D19075E